MKERELRMCLKGQLEYLDIDLCCLADSLGTISENADKDVADILHCLARFTTGLAVTVEEMIHDYCKE